MVTVSSILIGRSILHGGCGGIGRRANAPSPFVAPSGPLDDGYRMIVLAGSNPAIPHQTGERGTLLLGYPPNLTADKEPAGPARPLTSFFPKLERWSAGRHRSSYGSRSRSSMRAYAGSNPVRGPIHAYGARRDRGPPLNIKDGYGTAHSGYPIDPIDPAMPDNSWKQILTISNFDHRTADNVATIRSIGLGLSSMVHRLSSTQRGRSSVGRAGINAIIVLCLQGAAG